MRVVFIGPKQGIEQARENKNLAEYVKKVDATESALAGNRETIWMFLPIRQDRIDRFGAIAESIESLTQVGRFAPNEGLVVVVVDASVLGLHPMNDEDGIFAMLMLAFPEVTWRFFNLGRDQVEEERSGCRKLADRLIQLYEFDSNARYIFDGLSDSVVLRSFIRMRFMQAGKLSLKLKQRVLKAVAVDDEKSFALFHAYTAYRHGFEAYACWTNAATASLLESETTHSVNGKIVENYSALIGKIDLVFEDIYLGFPDRPPGAAYSYLRRGGKNCRAKAFPKLADAQWRIFVSYGHDQSKEGLKVEQENNEFIASDNCCRGTKERSGKCKLIYKPHAGMFDLWHQAEIEAPLGFSTMSTETPEPTGEAATERTVGQNDNGNDCVSAGRSRHSAPGRLLITAEFMVQRAKDLLEKTSPSMAECVLAATLALDAQELLGNLTPTASIEAMRVKHRAEVIAECQYAGVHHRISIKPRLDEIKAEAEKIAMGFEKNKREQAADNAAMSIMLDIMRVLRSTGKFDEAVECQNRIRHLHNQLALKDSDAWNFWNGWRIGKTLARVWFWYTEKALASLKNFGVLILIWYLFFVVSFSLFGRSSSPAGAIVNGGQDVGYWEQPFMAMTGTSMFNSTDVWWNVFNAMAVVVGLVHFGLFLSHIYIMVSRKD